jgi:hypothetical protein
LNSLFFKSKPTFLGLSNGILERLLKCIQYIILVYCEMGGA